MVARTDSGFPFHASGYGCFAIRDRCGSVDKPLPSDEGQGMNEVWKIVGETAHAHKVGDDGNGEGGCRDIYE